MRPRFAGRLGLADGVTTVNAALGFVAVAVATVDPFLAARIVLLAAIADALDGIVARYRGGTEVGQLLDSLADVASFGVAPAMIVVVLTDGPPTTGLGQEQLVGIGLGAAFVAMGVIRLALYTAYDTDEAATEGVQTTLAATLLAVGVLAGVPGDVLLWSLPVFAVLMVLPLRYPDLKVRDAVIMGGVQALALLFPTVWSAVFPRVLLAWAIGYLVLGPWVYPGAEGKRS